MKDRPNISITPVVPLSSSSILSSPNISISAGGGAASAGSVGFIPAPVMIPPKTSPGKTLQEKLADKQKQSHSKSNIHSKQFTATRNIEAEIIKKDICSSKSGGLNIPASLTVSKATAATVTTVPPGKYSAFGAVSVAAASVTSQQQQQQQVSFMII